MKRLLAVCAGTLFLAACNDATAPITPKSSAPVAPSNGPNADIRPGHYIVLLKSGAPSAEAVVHRHALSKALTVDQHFKTVMHGFAAAFSEEDLDSLRNDPDVERIEPDRIVHQLGSETGMGWALDRVDQHAMPLNGSFSYGATGSGVNIYVVDGGIRYSHTEFGGRAHFAFDALGGDGSDCNGHGTGVAGVAAGSVHGVAKSANIYSVRVFPCSGTTNLSTILAGVDWVTAHHKSPAVANLSLGAAAAPILDTAVERSIRSGVTYVVAAGNNGGDACAMSPGKLPDVINVGASDASDSRASWSNYGSCVHIFAPGVAVGSADYYSDVSYANWNGTSMAAPLVSGAVALYLQEHPTASPSAVRSAMLSSTTSGVISNASGSANRLLYTSFIGTVSAPAPAPAPAPTTSTPPTAAPVGGVGVSYRCASRACNFDAGSSQPTGGVTSYKWYFGDGSSATGRTASHTYGSSPSYRWVLYISTGTGKRYAVDNSITPASASGTVSSTAPTYVPPTTSSPPPSGGSFSANFTVSCNVKHSCTFDASSSVIPNGVSSFNWFFGDGYEGTTVRVTHDYSGRKTVSVRLKIYDKTYAYREITKTVTVP